MQQLSLLSYQHDSISGSEENVRHCKMDKIQLINHSVILVGERGSGWVGGNKFTMQISYQVTVHCVFLLTCVLCYNLTRHPTFG